MSWSINLSGAKAMVQSELKHAVVAICHAMDALNEAPGPLVNVSVCGSAYENPQPGNSDSGANWNVGSYFPPPPPPPPVEAEVEPEPAAPAS